MKSQDKQPNIFKPLAFYHPAPENKGIALSFSYNSSEDKLYLNILRQTGWDNDLKRGTFSGEDKKVVKFSQKEAATIAFCISEGSFFSTQHTFNNIQNEIALTPSETLDYELNIRHIVDGNATVFTTDLDIGESHLLKLYIENAIKESFYH